MMPKGHIVNKESEKLRMDMWWNGKDDVEIAAAVGVHPNVIFAWRKKRGLPPNGISGRKGRKVKSA